MTDATDTFGAHAAHYDEQRRRLIPSYDAFYGAAVRALGLVAAPGPARILDLGAGTGLLSRHVLDAYPGAHVTLLDGAPAMLDQARAALGDRHDYVVGDLNDPLPGDGYNAVVSALAIHHVDDAAKRALFARVHEALVPGGVFVNAEHVAGSTPLAGGPVRPLARVGVARARRDRRATGPTPNNGCRTTGARTPARSSPGCARPASPTSTACSRTTASRSCVGRRPGATSSSA